MTAADPTTTIAPGHASPTAGNASTRVASPGDHRWRLGDVVALLLILLVALGLRIAAVNDAPSADEVWHLALSRGAGSPVGMFEKDVAYVDVPPIHGLDGAAPAWRVWTHMDGVLHPPLYVLALRLWRDVFGGGIPAAHAMSIAWSMVAIGFAFAAARLAMGRAAAVWASLLIAVAPVQIYFAQEIRGYEMMIGLGAISLWLATRIEVFGPTPRRAATLGLLALPLLLTHYFAAGGAVGMAVYAAARLRGRPLAAFVVASVIAGAIYVAAWFPFAIRQLAALHTGDAFTKVDEVNILQEGAWALAIPARLFLERPWLQGTVRGMTCAIFGLIVLAAPWYFRRRMPAVFPWACWLGASVATLVALDLARTTFLVMIIRYAAIASPAVFLLVVAIVRSIGPRTMAVTCAAGIAAMLIVRPPDGGLVADAPNFAGTARWLADQIQPGEGIMVIQGTAGDHTADLVMLTLSHEPGLFPRTVVKVDGPLTPEALRLLPDRAWAVMVDRDDDRVRRTLRSATLVASYGIIDEGMCDLYDLRAARAASTQPTSATRPATSTRPAVPIRTIATRPASR